MPSFINISTLVQADKHADIMKKIKILDKWFRNTHRLSLTGAREVAISPTEILREQPTTAVTPRLSNLSSNNIPSGFLIYRGMYIYASFVMELAVYRR
jgi:hypothetical protein